MAQRRLLRWMRTSTRADRILALLALSPLLVLLVRQVMELGTDDVPCCDFAALELGTRAFLRGDQFFGLYSREGWRHPGPAPFLWSALFRLIPGRSFAEHQIAAATLSLAAVTTVIVATWNRVTAVGRSIVIVVVSIFIVRFGLDGLRSPWNPYEAAMWTLIAVVCTAVFTQTRSTFAVGVAVFAGSMAAQSHVGAAPTVVVCFTVIGWNLVRTRHRRDSVRNTWTAGSVFMALWFLPLADLAFGNRNLVKILSTNSAPAQGMDRSELLTGAMWITGNSPGRIGETFGPASPFLDVRDVIFLDVVAVVLVLALVTLAIVRWRSDRLAATLAGLSILGGFATIAALLLSDSEYLRYLLLPIAGLAPVLWIASGLTASRLLQKYEHNVLRLVAWPVVIALSIFSIIDMDRGKFVDPYVNPDVQSVVAQVEDDCSALPDTSVVRISEDIEWFDALPVIVGIERCSKVRVIGHVGFLAGQPYQAAQGSIPNVFITSTGDERGVTTIATSASVKVAVSED